MLAGLLAGAPALAADLTVSAAASLTNAFKEIGAAFEAAHPDTRVQLNFGASGALLQQIAKGAPVDVFASADQETMNQAEQQQLVKPGARVNFVSNSLVVVVPQDATVGAEDPRRSRHAGGQEGRDRRSRQRSGRPLHQGGAGEGRSSGRRSRPR